MNKVRMEKVIRYLRSRAYLGTFEIKEDEFARAYISFYDEEFIGEPAPTQVEMEANLLDALKHFQHIELKSFAEGAYWDCFSLDGIPPIVVKDYILLISPQLGMKETPQAEFIRNNAFEVIKQARQKAGKITGATTPEEVESVVWDIPPKLQGIVVERKVDEFGVAE